MNATGDTRRIALNQKSLSSHKANLQQEIHAKKVPKKDNKMILWFEVDDTGCGMRLRTELSYLKKKEKKKKTCIIHHFYDILQELMLVNGSLSLKALSKLILQQLEREYIQCLTR